MPGKPTCEELEANVHKLKNAELDRLRTEELLRDEISWRRMLVEESRDGIVVLDQDGRVYEANKRYADMLGYSMEEVYQLYVWDWDLQFDREQLMEMIRNVDDSGARFETQHRRKDGATVDVELSNNGTVYRGQKLVFCVCRDVTERKKAEEERERLILELTEALAKVKTLSGLLPVCASCKRIRNDQGYWQQMEMYIREHSEADFSHGICPECAEKLYPELYENK